MAKSSGGYFGLGFIVSLVLAIIPISNIVLGIITRAQNGNFLGVILNIILFPIFWIIDLVSIIAKNKVFVLA